MYVPFLHGHLEYLGRVYSAGSIQAMGCACSYMCVCVCVCVRALKSKLAVLCLKLHYSEMFAGNQYRSDLFST